MNQPAIITDQLTFDFGALRAVERLSLTVRRGAIYGLLGPNGAGKTTVIRLLLGLLEPTSGVARVLGMKTTHYGGDIRRRTGALLEGDKLYENLTALENLRYYGRLRQMNEQESLARSQELLVGFELWDRRDEPIQTWSRGMRKKLAVARTLLNRPELILLDEPTGGLDPVATATLYSQLQEFSVREGTTIFLTTHKLSEAEQLCNEVAILYAGRLMAEGPVAELRALGAAPLLLIRGDGFNEAMVALLARRRDVVDIRIQPHSLLIELADADTHISPLINLLVESGADIEEVQRTNASLESVVMRLVREKKADQDIALAV